MKRKKELLKTNKTNTDTIHPTLQVLTCNYVVVIITINLTSRNVTHRTLQSKQMMLFVTNFVLWRYNFCRSFYPNEFHNCDLNCFETAQKQMRILNLKEINVISTQTYQ